MKTKQATTKSGSKRLRAALSALCLILLASCSQDETAVLPEAQQAAKWVLTATIGNNTPQTKATVKYGQPYEIGEDFTWELNDLINLSLEPVSGGDGTKYGLRFKVTAVSENGNTATLEQYNAAGYAAPSIPPGEYRLYAAYPSDIRLIEGAEHQASGNYTMGINSSGVATWQTASMPDFIYQPEAAVNLNNTAVPNPKAWLYMYDWQPTVTIGSGEVNLKLNFKHYTSLLRYTLTNTTTEAVTLNSIVLNFAEASPFGALLTLNAENPAALTTGGTNAVWLTSGLSIAPNQTADFYCPIVPSAAYSENSSYQPANASGIELTFRFNDGATALAPITLPQFIAAFGADAFKPGYRYAFDLAITGTADNLAIKRMKTYKTYTANGVSFKMVNVEGGTFTMGATAEQGSDASSNELPTHSVTLSSFAIGQTEVTQALWLAVMGAHNSTQNRGSGDNYPEHYVSWDDIVGTTGSIGYTVNGIDYKTDGFCYKLSQLVGGGKQFYLPTEAQWEYAARGGNQSAGYKYSGSNTIDNVAWYYENSGAAESNYTSHEVATKQANELGIYDMSGNVFEWCSDWYGSYSNAAQTNPTGNATGSFRVLRGGDWHIGARYCRVSYRYYNFPSSRSNDRGFRLASGSE
ncbi:MAG: formylglycine-generating enzyme family protein [Dysgonamonadaceae bacterium]|jgi:formylglycine-generating enzyme required for sulfatase activity|nr:formylglycine-generating enzyme family protein [Dysgonamonadaceae bacterium]